MHILAPSFGSYNVQSPLDENDATQSFFSSPAIANGNIDITSKDHFITVLSKELKSNIWQIILFVGILIIMAIIVSVVIRYLLKIVSYYFQKYFVLL